MAKMTISSQKKKGEAAGAASPSTLSWQRALTPEQQAIGRRVMLEDPRLIQAQYNHISSAFGALNTALGAGWQQQNAESFAGMQKKLEAIRQGTQRLRGYQTLLGDESPQALADSIAEAERAYDVLRGQYDSAYNAWDMEQHRPIMATEQYGAAAQGTGNLFLRDAESGVGIYQGRRNAGMTLETGDTRGWRGARAAGQQGLAEARQRQAEEQHARYMGTDVASLRAEADEMDAFLRARHSALTYDAAAHISANMARERAYAQATQELRDAYGFSTLREAEARVSELRRQAALAERYQTQAGMTEAALTDPEFRAWAAQGAAAENPTLAEYADPVFARPEIGNVATFARSILPELEEAGQQYDMPYFRDRLSQARQAARMTDEEVDIYSYYLARYGKEEADRYLASLGDTLNARTGKELSNAAQGNYLAQLGVGWLAGSDQFRAGVEGFGRAVAGSEQYVPVSAYQYASGYVQDDIRQYGGERSDKWFAGQWWKTAGVNISSTTANMMPSILVSAAITAATDGAGAPAAVQMIGEAVGAAIVGATAGGNAYDEMIRLGYSAGQARGYAALTGASEAGLQYVLGGITQLGGVVTNGAVTKLIENVDNALARTAIQLGGEFLSEGLEEYLQDVLEPVFRNMVLYENNEVNFLSEDAIYSGVLGGISALMLSGGGTVANNYMTYRQGLAMQRAGVTAQRVAEIGMTLPADSAAYRLASQVNEKTGAFTAARLFNEIGAVLTEQNVADITAALVERGMTREDAETQAAWLAIAMADPDLLSAAQQTALENDPILAAVIDEVVMRQGTALNTRMEGMNAIGTDMEFAAVERAAQARRKRQEREERKNRSPEANALNDQLRRAAGEEIEGALPEVDAAIFEREQAALREMVRSTDDDALLPALAQRQQEVISAQNAALDAGRGLEAEAYRRVNETMTEAVTTYMEQQNTAALRDYIMENTGGIENGGADISDGDGRRLAGESAGVEAGAVRPGEDSAVREGIRDGGSYDGVDGQEARSSRELGLRNGTDNKVNRPVPREAWSESMTAAADRAAALGYDVTYVTGAMEIVNPTTGRVQRVTGFVDEGRIVVSADRRFYSPEALVAHEAFHARAAADRALVQEVYRQMLEQYGAEALREMVARYAEKYAFVYGEVTESTTADEAEAIFMSYFEEIAADAYAGITRQATGRGAAQFTEDVRALVQEREGMGNGSGGMPGVRYAVLYSVDDVELTEEERNQDKRDILTKLREHIPELEKENAIAYANPDGFAKGEKRYTDQAADYYETFGSRVTRLGFGVIHMDEDGAKSDLGHGLGRAKAATTAAIPQVLRNGKQIDFQQNWKGRGYDTYVFAGKVLLGEQPTYVAAVVKKGKDSNFYLHEVIAADGSMIKNVSSSENFKTRVTVQDGVTRGSELPDNSIPSSAENSNPEFDESVPSAEALRRQLDRAVRGETDEAQTATERGPKFSMDEDEDIPMSSAEYAQRQAAEQTEADREAEERKKTVTELRRQVNEERANLAALDRFAAEGSLTEAQDARRSELRQKLEREQAELAEHNRRIAAERAEAKERARKRQRPTQVRKDFIRKCTEEFSTAQGMRAEMGEILGSFFDKSMREGRVDEEMFSGLLDRLFNAGMVTIHADPYAEAMSGDIAGTRIYVPEDVRSEFGDAESYNAFRRKALAQGVILTSERGDNHIDGMYAELKEMYPGAFRSDGTDAAEALREIVDTAREGKDENVSLWEMMQRTEGNEGYSVDEQIDRFENTLRNFTEQAMYAAGIEVEQKARSAVQLAQERAARRETMRRQAEQRQLRELQQKTLKILQWLSKNRNRAPAERRAQWDEALADIDLYAISAANEMNWSEKHQATWRDLHDMYLKAKETDPNWLPSKELERIVARLDMQKIGDMDVDALNDLYKLASGLRTEFYNRNNLINDEEHRLFSEVYHDSTAEMKASGGKGHLGRGIGRLTVREMMTPMNVFEMMGGWNPQGQWYSMGKQLQAGERARKGYELEARAMLDAFRTEYADWIKTADGRGKNAVWYEVEVPELLELHMGDKPIFGEPKTVYMTPMQRVQLYLESKNYQNLQHMTGGRIFVNKEMYAKGETAEALAQGTTIRLAPETVKRLVSDMTTEELALASVLERYYNGYAAGRINEVSNALLGYDKAMTENYAPIFTDSNYNKTTAGIFDVTAEGVGHMKGREQVSKTPSFNLSAIDAFERHVGQTARYVGLAIPVHNVETLMNWGGDGTSLKKVMSEKWGKESVDYVTDLMTRLQSPTSTDSSIIQRLGQKAVSNYISAVFGANPGIVFKQAASYPAAAAVLGFKNMPTPAQMTRVDEALVAKYTPELAARKTGAVPEVAEMAKAPSVLDQNKVTRFLLRGGAITWMDATTVKNIWPWAENYVRQTFPELEIGTQEMIDAGLSPFYQKVAEAFNEAVNTTQPMYDVMNRAGIMNDSNALTRTFTLFKTVPLQEYNTLRKYIGEMKTGGKAAKVRAAAAAVASVLVSTLMLETVEAANAWVKNGLKGYKDDDDELTLRSFAERFGLNVAGDLAGIMIGGSEIFEWATNQLSGGKRGYSSDFTIVGTEQINELKDMAERIGGMFAKTASGIWDVAHSGGDVGEYLHRNGGDIRGTIHDAAAAWAEYFEGLPVENVEKYIGGIMAKIFPEAKAEIEGWFDTTTKADLAKLYGDELESRLGGLLAIRGIDVDDGTAEELARLYLAGEKAAVPSDTPTSITVDGESVALSAYELQAYDNTYAGTIGDGLDALVESDAYIEADDAMRAKMLSRLYDYAAQTAARQVKPEYEGDKWTQTAAEAVRQGVPLEAYVALQAQGLRKNADKLEFIDEMNITDEQRGIMYYHAVASESRREDVDALRGAGMDWGTVWETMREYLGVEDQDMTASMKTATFKTWAYENLPEKWSAAAIDNLYFSSGMRAESGRYDKLVDAGLEPEDALSVVSGWNALTPEDGRSSVSRAQEMREVAGRDLSDEEKYAAIGALMGTEMTTASGSPTAYAKMRTVIDAGVSWDDYLDMYEGGAVDRWMKLRDAGVSARGAVSGAIALTELEPEDGKKQVSDLQKMNTIIEMVSGNDDQLATIRTVLTDEGAQKLSQAGARGISARTYVNFQNTLQGYYAYDPNGSDTSLSQSEVTAALNSMDLTMYDKAVLWQIQTMGKDGKNNPYITSVGKEIYDEYQAWKLSGQAQTSSSSGTDGPAPVGYFPGLQLPGI